MNIKFTFLQLLETIVDKGFTLFLYIINFYDVVMSVFEQKI